MALFHYINLFGWRWGWKAWSAAKRSKSVVNSLDHLGAFDGLKERMKKKRDADAS